MSLYALNTSYISARQTAYCSVSLTAGTLVSGVGQCYPTSNTFTYMSFQQAISYQVPPGDVSIGGVVDATTNVAGNVIVSPALDVDFTVDLYGRGTTLGTYTVPAGQTSGSFNFNVSSVDAIPQEEIGAAMEKIAKPQK